MKKQILKFLEEPRRKDKTISNALPYLFGAVVVSLVTFHLASEGYSAWLYKPLAFIAFLLIAKSASYDPTSVPIIGTEKFKEWARNEKFREGLSDTDKEEYDEYIYLKNKYS